ncbi:efflux RND transporter periplasmic adaptor subunit [Myxococcota bacterium]|nr:efflux RND transporter periplasmic adaptor subunit [Myxococcota bacterium]
MSADARPPAPPSRRPLTLLVLVLAIAAGAWFVMKRGEPVAGPKFKTEAVSKRTIVRRVEASGHLEVSRRVEVPSLLQGRLLSVGTRVGDTVKSGTVLARIEPQPTSMNPEVAAAQFAAAQGTVAQAAIEAQANADAREQAAKLAAKGLVGETESRQTQAKAQAASAALAAAKGQAAAARAALAEAKRLASFSALVAPIDGVVIVAPDEEGRLVGPAAGPIFVLADTLDRLQLAAEVSELDVALLKIGVAAEISVDALPGERFPAKVLSVGLTPARSGAMVTYPVTFELENPGQRLRPGLSATARVEADRASDVLAVPEAALRFAPADAPPAEDRARVFRIGSTGAIEAVAVRAGLSDGAFTAVEGVEKGPALNPGDAVIVGNAKGDEPAAAGGINLSGKKP